MTRTRWLTFANDRGGVVMAPGVRTHQLTLLLAMGREWFERAMTPECTAEELAVEFDVAQWLGAWPAGLAVVP